MQLQQSHNCPQQNVLVCFPSYSSMSPCQTLVLWQNCSQAASLIYLPIGCSTVINEKEALAARLLE
jgi:hypothetical protein